MKLMLILLFLFSCSHQRVVLEGRAISMTKIHLQKNEKLKVGKKRKITFCNEHFKKRLKSAVEIVNVSQKKLKVDFFLDFIITEKRINPIKVCYILEGIPARISKRHPRN